MPIIVQPVADGFDSYSGEQAGTPLANITALLGDLQLGVIDDYGAALFLTAIDGWWNGTGSTGEVTQRVGAHGGWSNRPYRTPRHIELTVEVGTIDYDRATAAIERVIAAVPLVGDTLMVTSGEESLQATVQQDGDPVLSRAENDSGKRPGWAKITIPLIAPDPRRYETSTLTATTGLPTTAGGMSLPLSLPLSIGASINSGRIITDTFGNTDTPPVFTVNGPCPPFQIAHSMADDSTVPRSVLRFAEAVPDGRSLTIDTARRLALMDGTATRTVTGTWFSYLPGKNGQPGLNQIDFTADSYDPGAQLVSVHRDAWK